MKMARKVTRRESDRTKRKRREAMVEREIDKLQREHAEAALQDEFQTRRIFRQPTSREVRDAAEKTPLNVRGVDNHINNLGLRLFPEGRRFGYNFLLCDHEWSDIKDRPHRELYPREWHKGHSKKFLDQSPEEFHATIDRAIRACGFSLEEIQDIARRNKRKDARKGEVLKLLRVYKKLRVWGYKRKELTP